MITTLTATIKTSSLRESGTNDRLWLDVGGHTFELIASPDPFERGHADAFVLPLPAPGIGQDDVWRVLLCKHPDHDIGGWVMAGITLTDQRGKVLYSRDGLTARVDASTGRQWLAPWPSDSGRPGRAPSPHRRSSTGRPGEPFMGSSSSNLHGRCPS